MSRRTALLLGFAAIAVAGPAVAADPYYPKAPAGSPLYQPASVITGNLDIMGGLAFGSGTSASGTAGTAGGIARANMPIHDGWNLQIDLLGFEMTKFEFIDKNAVNMDHENVGITGYFYKREGNWAWGPFVSFEKRASDYPFKSGEFGLGFGPQFGPWEVHAYGSVGYVTNGTVSGASFGGQIGAAYWLTRNTAVGADVMYNNFGVPGINKNVWTFAVNALHRLENMPIALLGSARIDSYSGATSATVTTLLAGARFYMNPMANDALGDTETGPAFQTKLPLPPNI